MKKAKLKNNSNKKFNFKYIKFLFLLFILCFSFVITTTKLMKDYNLKNDEYLNYFLNNLNNKSNDNFIMKKIIKFVSKIDLSDSNSLLDNKFTSIGTKATTNVKKYEKDEKANDDDYSTDAYNQITSYIENPISEKENPIVYIYNSHQLETYSTIGFEGGGVSPNVLMVSYLLAEKLNNYNINTIVEDTNIAEFIRVSNLASDSFYTSTRIFLKNIMNKYNSLKYFIDIHRDSVNKDISTCTINDKNYARILFVLGTSNPNYKENEKLMKSLDDIADKLYPGLSRGIYNRPTPNWSLVYNQDLNSGVILIEVGAKENNIEEVMNTIEALGNIIKKYIEGN